MIFGLTFLLCHWGTLMVHMCAKSIVPVGHINGAYVPVLSCHGGTIWGIRANIQLTEFSQGVISYGEW